VGYFLGALTALCHLAGLACLAAIQYQPGPGPRSARAVGLLKWQLALWLAAGLCWLGMILAWRLWSSGEAVTMRKRALLGIALLGLLMRLPALTLPAVHSDDVYRYVWDGAVQAAGLSPYAGPPEAPIYAPVQAARPDVFALINHRHLPTIYPPMAQAVFGIAAAASSGQGTDVSVRAWKALCGGAELALWLALLGLLGQKGRDRRWLALWALSPLPAVEVWLNGHADAVGLLLLAAALWAFRRQRTLSFAAAGSLLMLAALVKPLALSVLPGIGKLQEQRRKLLLLCLGALLAGLCAWWPYRQTGLHVAPSLGEYGRRWRSNEGAYALLHRSVEEVTSVVYRPPYYDPWRIKALARLVSGRDRDTVWPDEMANFLARAAVAAALLWLMLVGRRSWLSPAQMGLLLLSGYALLTPTLHPWYLLWPLMLATLWPQAAPPVLVLAALSPLAYLPLAEEWAGKGHHETILARAIEHGAAWLAVLWVLWRRDDLLDAAASS